MEHLSAFTRFWLPVLILASWTGRTNLLIAQSVNWQGNPLVVGVWWDTTNGNSWSDQQLTNDVRNIKWMNFTAIYCVEKNILDGSKDDSLNNTWTGRVVEKAEQEGLKIVWAVWETDNPVQWVNRDLNNNTFRIWFADHLTKWQQFVLQHPCIIEIVFDDFGPESQYLNMTEFTEFVRQYIPLPTMIEYDDIYYGLNPQYGVGTVNEGYVYNYQDTRSWSSFWIDYIYGHYDGSYPFHTLGICLEAFDEGMGGWTPAKHRPLIDRALYYNFSHYEYWAWRWATPESPAIAAHPEYWQEIKQNNEYIQSHITVPEFAIAVELPLFIFVTTILLVIFVRFAHPSQKREKMFGQPTNSFRMRPCLNRRARIVIVSNPK